MIPIEISTPISIPIKTSSSSMEFFLLLLVLALLQLLQLHAQQSYVDNKQLDCNKNWSSTLGFVCNGASPFCTSYLTFRSTPTYSSPVTIAYLLSADATRIAAANNISDIQSLPVDTLVIVPVSCSCSRNYYQHNSSYVLKHQGETYFTVANDTYQALTTCQAMEAQNPYNYRQLYPDMKLAVPLLCACPTSNQTAAGYKYLLTYLIRQGNTFDYIARVFSGAGADVQGILDANMLTADHLIFFFTPILVPLKTEPTKQNINTMASPPPPRPPPTLPTTPAAQVSGSTSRKWVFISVGIGAAVLIVLSVSLVWWICYRRPRHHKSPKLAEESGEAARPLSNLSVSSDGIRIAIETLTLYKFEDLEKATNSFADTNRIKGSSVYCGSFKGDDAVVKMTKGDVSGVINVLRQINHSHIVRLSGYCLHQGITYLVYEYAEKGPLADWLRPGGSTIKLQKKDSPEKHYSPLNEGRLDWKQRLWIAYDVADALNYLHNFTNPPHIHKNLTSNNILLDGNMRAKVANFGLARNLGSDNEPVLTRHVVGTHGYMAPEYIETGLVTPKLDVFALGVVMLELLSGREPIVKVSNGNDRKDEGGELLLSQSIEAVLDGENVREKLREFVDPSLREEYQLELAYSMAELARSCVAHNLDARPPVSEVFIALSKLLSSSLDWDPSHETSFSFS